MVQNSKESVGHTFSTTPIVDAIITAKITETNSEFFKSAAFHNFRYLPLARELISVSYSKTI